ncbi:hypothetical protein PgNI_05198 [Pyricularia grisea]|uniref:Uncharacterized protein n=1 Tax=Pyricularia grisea TaxID=148305 RepID=A0A6P8B7K0_PYRGI|nr:uncharacterized protein PgNI_12586 [Pyricularia grisea]XP_030983108.1 hypothetical protein PgNI_05198 [Pyricularia grisea]TLD03087.1 hypothetical protein PgNI_12586 [Pyricularia grisea]TLD11218.1 hypothetical protein PgNI_05198 [Pyricularia grisea]
MKAYKTKTGEVRLFRPSKNMDRLNKSARQHRPPNLQLKRSSRYYFATLGFNAPGSALLYVITSPVGPFYPIGSKAISLDATDYAVRAWPGGAGNKKIGANYAPCIVPHVRAMASGFQQNLWLFGKEEYEFITAPIDGTILEGVTRDSILALVRQRLAPEGWAISERNFTMKDVYDAFMEGRLIEAFGAATAAVVSPIRNISWKGKFINCGLADHEESGGNCCLDEGMD